MHPAGKHCYWNLPCLIIISTNYTISEDLDCGELETTNFTITQEIDILAGNIFGSLSVSEINHGTSSNLEIDSKSMKETFCARNPSVF